MEAEAARKGRYVARSVRIEAVSKVFQNGKTQVPREVRRSLGLEDGDKMVWVLDGDRWIVRNAKSLGESPV
jgi:bifunctional DNA-binding transcriptional regulator/antitoxin component of YhaV-PrlF toxin-antitoxin module